MTTATPQTPEFTWTATALDTAKTLAGHDNIVVAVQWRCTYGTPKLTVTLEGKCYLPTLGPNATVIPFDQLTQDIVRDWLVNEMWTETVEHVLRERYDTLHDTVPEAPQFVDQMMMRPIMWGG